MTPDQVREVVAIAAVVSQEVAKKKNINGPFVIGKFYHVRTVTMAILAFSSLPLRSSTMETLP